MASYRYQDECEMMRYKENIYSYMLRENYFNFLTLGGIADDALTQIVRELDKYLTTICTKIYDEYFAMGTTVPDTLSLDMVRHAAKVLDLPLTKQYKSLVHNTGYCFFPDDFLDQYIRNSLGEEFLHISRPAHFAIEAELHKRLDKLITLSIHSSVLFGDKYIEKDIVELSSFNLQLCLEDVEEN